MAAKKDRRPRRDKILAAGVYLCPIRILVINSGKSVKMSKAIPPPEITKNKAFFSIFIFSLVEFKIFIVGRRTPATEPVIKNIIRAMKRSRHINASTVSPTARVTTGRMKPYRPPLRNWFPTWRRTRFRYHCSASTCRISTMPSAKAPLRTMLRKSSSIVRRT